MINICLLCPLAGLDFLRTPQVIFAKRYRDIWLSSLEKKGYPRAKSFIRKDIEPIFDSDAPIEEVPDSRILLTVSCGLQGKWVAVV
jgi:hypothetical protein